MLKKNFIKILNNEFLYNIIILKIKGIIIFALIISYEKSVFFSINCFWMFKSYR